MVGSSIEFPGAKRKGETKALIEVPKKMNNKSRSFTFSNINERVLACGSCFNFHSRSYTLNAGLCETKISLRLVTGGRAIKLDTTSRDTFPAFFTRMLGSHSCVCVWVD